MKLEVLASVMNRRDPSEIIKSMNLNSDAIIINQTDRNEYNHIKHKKYDIKFYSFSERGVGLSRNNALMRSTGDIVIFADEDISYVNNYKEIIINEFKKNPKADMIIFNVPSTNNERPTVQVNSKKRIYTYNCLKYGAVNFAVKTSAIKKYNVYFSLLFGGGAKYSAGEDSLFIYKFIKSGGKVYTAPITIGTVAQESSTWFNGYTKKYFFDKGAFYANISKKHCKLLCIQYLIRHNNVLNNTNFFEAYKEMKKGIGEFNK